MTGRRRAQNDAPARMNDDSAGRAQQPEFQGPPELRAPHPEAPEDAAEESRQPRRWPWLLAGLAIVVAGAAVFWFMARPQDGKAQPPPAPPLVRSTLAEPAERLVIRQTGFVRPKARVEVSAEIGGRIAEVGEDFRVGAVIEQGSLLIRLDTTGLRADIDSAEASVAQARAALADAKVERDRQKQLEERDFASEAALQQAVVRVATAEADLSAAQAALTQARDRLKQATVAAPFDALVTAETAARGALVQPGVTVGTLVAADAVEVEMGLTPADLDVLGQAERSIGGRVSLFPPDAPGQLLARGEVTSVDPDIAPQTRTVGLIVTVPDPFAREGTGSRPLRVDELVLLELPVSLARRDVVAVPPEAVKGRGTVWAIPSDRLQRRDVRILQRGEDRVLIGGADLPAGTRVMLSDLPDAVDGQAVRLDEDGTEAQDGAGGGG